MILGANRVAVVTGAAGGIGRALSLSLAHRGCDLALVDVNQPELERTAAMVALTGRRASLHQIDVSDQAQMQALPNSVLASHAAIHILINNVGVSLAWPFESARLEDMEWIIKVNLWGVIFGCRFFLPYLRRESEAHIVNVSSDFGLIGFPSKTLYCATKFAIRGFSEALRTELHGSGIDLTCVYPGAVNTGLIRNGRASEANKKEREAEFIERRSIRIEKVAEKIVRAIERRSSRVIIGRDSYAIDLMTRLFPVLTNNLVSRLQKRIPFV